MLKPVIISVAFMASLAMAMPASAQRAPRGAPAVDPVPAAQAIATAAGLNCQVTEAVLLGQTQEKHNLLEAACATGPGYILEGSTPPKTFDCVLLAATAAQLRADGQEIPPGTSCNLPANQNVQAVIAGYAREASVPCEIDAGKIVGSTSEGNTVYEVGCPGADGYRIEKSSSGWSKTDCLQIVAAGANCEFTTAAEQVAGFKPKLVGSDIDDCDAQQIRLMGQNDNGQFIEVKCASGEGYVTRLKEDAIAQVYPCAIAQRVGGGCTLTPVAAASEQQQQ